jgi:hypothetical protein
VVFLDMDQVELGKNTIFKIKEFDVAFQAIAK